MNCLICGGAEHLILEQRDHAPIAQNLVYQSKDAALNCAVGRLEMRRCVACGFVWNAAFDSGLVIYDTDYDNDQNFSPKFRDHTRSVVRKIVNRLGDLDEVKIAEVGCGQGKFLAEVAGELKSRLLLAQGFDPAWRGNDADIPNCQISRSFFGPSSISQTGENFHLIFSRHVIEHIADPIQFLTDIRSSVPTGTPVVIETPDVDWILKNGVFFDFYYEHCSLFNPSSLRRALEKTGFTTEEVEVVFDGQYMVATAVASEGQLDTSQDNHFDDLGYREHRSKFMRDLERIVEDARRHGSVALWGGASKGVTICLTLPAANALISAVIDINERKQNCYMPRSGIPILAPSEACANGITSAIIVNPAYLEEIEQLCREAEIPIRLHVAQ